MKVNAKSLLISTVVCSLAVASIPSMTPAAKATPATDEAVPWCVDNSQSSDWTDGCLRGEKFCMDGFPYPPAPSSDKYSEGYIAGWEHAGCTSQK